MQNLIFPSPTLAPYLRENQQPVPMVKPGAKHILWELPISGCKALLLWPSLENLLEQIEAII